jgi:hypothetical protein
VKGGEIAKAEAKRASNERASEAERGAEEEERKHSLLMSLVVEEIALTLS